MTERPETDTRIQPLAFLRHKLTRNMGFSWKLDTITCGK